jgi:hypothetical protein
MRHRLSPQQKIDSSASPIKAGNLWFLDGSGSAGQPVPGQL